MNKNYVFFRLDNEEITTINKVQTALNTYTIEIFFPTLFQLKKHSGKIFIYIFWFLLTRGKYRIIYVKKGNVIIHYTHILPKFFKFPFMKDEDLEIGPAWTDISHRGQGIFPSVIGYIVQYFKKDGRNFYTFSHVDNEASKKSILRAGFNRWANGYKTSKLGIYKVKKYE